MSRSSRRLLRGTIDRLMAPYVVDLATRSEQIEAKIDDRFAALNARIDALGDRVEALASESQRRADETAEKLRELGAEAELSQRLLRHVHEEDAALRRRLYALRASEDYELAFAEAEPLVTFVTPTYDRFKSLRDVALPSILAQTYPNIEVVVSGDGAPPETAKAIAELDDPRVRYINRSVRGPYPDDPARRWYVIGTPAYNDGVAAARGRWIAGLGDDDAVRPEHAERLVEAARRNRYEHCYGLHAVHYKGGETLEVGAFPPQYGQFVLQASIYHAGLRFFQMEPADYLSKEPNDWSLCRRMLLAGVRFGMVDEILVDKYESRYDSHSEWAERGIPSVE